MVNTCGEIEHCTPRTEATPSGEGVASLGGGWWEGGEEGGKKCFLMFCYSSKLNTFDLSLVCATLANWQYKLHKYSTKLIEIQA